MGLNNLRKTISKERVCKKTINIQYGIHYGYYNKSTKIQFNMKKFDCGVFLNNGK